MSWKKLKKFWLDVSYLPLILTACITVSIIYIIYNQTQVILTERLRERITSVAALAAVQIDSVAVDNVRTYDDLHSESLKRLVETMRRIRTNTKDVKYVYILRPTAKPTLTQFVADADMIEPVDWDGNGEIDEVEIPPLPGDDYDISDNPTARIALSQPVAAENVYTDKWGTFLSAYAPIRNKAGEATSVIGVDVQVDQFSALIREMFIPFLLLSGLLLVLLIAQTIALVKIWGNRIKFVRELDRQKDELISIVSHQLNTPVSAVKWNIEMFLDGDLGKMSDDQTKQLNSMQSEVSNLADLVSMLLDVSRIQLGRMQVNRADLDLKTFFEEEIKEIKPLAEMSKVKFVTSLLPKIPAAFLDKRLVRMTLQNLLTNAIKYTPEKGEASLHVEVRNGKLYYEVKDTGCGIPKAEQDRMFQKLFRASNVVNAKEGNGLGMFVAKGAVEAQGGSIRFESTEGKGTTFFVEIPLGQKSDTATGK